MNDEALHILLKEVEAIDNLRPITTETINDIQSDVPLLTLNLMTMES